MAQRALRGGNTFDQVAAMIENGTIDELSTDELTTALVPAALTSAIDDMRQEIVQLRSLVEFMAESMKALPAHNDAQIAADGSPEQTANEPLTDTDALKVENDVLRQALEEARANARWSWRRRMAKSAAC